MEWTCPEGVISSGDNVQCAVNVGFVTGRKINCPVTNFTKNKSPAAIIFCPKN